MPPIGRRWTVIVAGLLALAAARPENASPATITVSQLMASLSPDKIGLSKHFERMELDKQCQSPVVDSKSFNAFENVNNVGPCLCTVIFNMTRELETLPLDAADLANASKSGVNELDSAAYSRWKNVTGSSASLKLLMDPLNNATQLYAMCHNFNNVLSAYCKFIDLEVLLLNIALQKPLKELAPKKIGVVLPEIKKLEIPIDEFKVPIETDDLSVPTSGPLNNESDANDSQKPDEPIISDKKHLDESLNINDDEETTTVDSIIQEQSSDGSIESPNDSDGPITETKKSPSPNLMINENNIYSKHQFSTTDDSHFLFYFSIMTILSMMFYLALYNKKKIIALVIEGRRSNSHRRRPNTASYSKVETDDGSTVF